MGGVIGDRPVYSFEKLKKMYPEQVETVILALRNGYSIACILNQLRASGIKNVGLLKPSAFDFGEKLQLTKNSEQIVWMDRLNKPLLPYLQVILIKTCNLNCKGCTHFANLYNKAPESDNIYDLEELRKDICQIAENADVFRLRLLGGEPLLYPYLKEALKFTRESFPNADIRVVTNGLLLPKASKDLLQSFHDNKIGIDVSPYKPTLKVKNQITAILQEFQINYDFEGFENGSIQTFQKNIDLNSWDNQEKAFKSCPSKQCLTLLKGKLYKCPFEAFSNKFFEYFSFKGNYDFGYDMREQQTDYGDILNTLYMHPAEACKYCSERVEDFDWSNTLNPEYTDWTVSGN